MSLGIERFVTGERLEIKRQKPGPDKKPVTIWESGARFSHYAKGGSVVVVLADGTVEKFPDGTWLRRDDKGGAS